MFSRSSSSLSSTLLFSLSLLMCCLFLYTSKNMLNILLEWDFMTMGTSSLSMYLILDPQGTALSSAVLFISANILNFATFYMSDEKFLSRFIHLVLLFVLSMNLLIFIPHFMFLLLGWDGLGLSSFLLVIYYYSPKALSAGMITALTNRIGDVLILISIGWCLTQGHWSIMNMWDTPNNTPLILFILTAAMTKSAQIPFSSWLPAAMAAPTPVSALVHSSTLVTAGVFLLVRFYSFLSLTPLFNKILLLMSSLTMIMAGLAAMVEADLKKIIALSTLSQLGVMMAAIALGSPTLALFHLITHALFKALLFVTAGSLIHMNNHIQDLRSVGGVFPQLPLTSSCFLISNMALCAMPFLAGFYSKDLILEMSMYLNQNMIIMFILAGATGLTAGYSVRFMLLTWASMNSYTPLHPISELYKESCLPAATLTLGAIVGGSSMNWMMMTPVTEPYLQTSMKMGPFFITIMGGLISIYMSLTKISLAIQFKNMTTAQMMMWFLVPMSTQLILKVPLKMSMLLTKIMDQGWNEYTGGQGIQMLTSSASKTITSPQKSMPTLHLSMISLTTLPLMFVM